MIVLLPVHIYLPGSRAGVEQYTEQLARALQGHGEVAVVTTRKVISRETGHVGRSVVNGVSVWEVVNNLCHDSVEGTWSEPSLERAFGEVLDEFKPDVVHFQHLMYWSAGLPALAKRTGAKVLFTLHDFWLMCARMGQLVDPSGSLCHLPSEEICAPCMSVTDYGQPPAALKWIRRLTRIRSATGIALDEPMRLARRVFQSSSSSAAATSGQTAELAPWKASYHQRREAFLALTEAVDLFLTPSNSLRERFIEWGLPTASIRQVAQGRDHTPFQTQPSQTRPAGGTRFGFLGTLAPHKGVAELIRAFRAVQAPDASLTIHGPHEKHPEYWRLLNELAAQDARVKLEGPVPSSEVPATLREFDYSCVPSLWDECCPLTIQEAFMAGVPVLASDLGGLAELVRPGQGGLVAAPGDVPAWTAALQSLVGNEALRAELQGSIPTVPNINEHVDELLALYRA